MSGVTYDTGALIAAERNDRQFWAMHAALLADNVLPTVPTPVLAEAWRGGARQANVSRVLRLCEIEELTFDQAKRVGVLAASSGHADVVDVAVVEGALRRGDAVVTSNPTHIRAIADSVGKRLHIAVV